MCRDCTHSSSLNSRLCLTLALALVSILSSGCAYTGGLRDYVHNCFKVGPE
jgi:hypothetical protein